MGYSHYEVSSFSKNQHKSNHNLGYWKGRDYLGIGPGAHSRIYNQQGEKQASVQVFFLFFFFFSSKIDQSLFSFFFLSDFKP